MTILRICRNCSEPFDPASKQARDVYCSGQCEREHTREAQRPPTLVSRPPIVRKHGADKRSPS